MIRALTTISILTWLFALALTTGAQTSVDRSVALVDDGVRSELITYSDLLWQLALEPGSQLDSVTSADLNRALQTQINQRIFTLEAERVPREALTEKEVNAAITELVSHFPSAADFEARLRRVGFKSIKDPNFERIITDRLTIEKYLDFRFRSFIVITPDDEAKYYNETFVPDFRKRYPGVVVPALEEKRAQIHADMTEEKVAAAIETFLDQAKTRVTIVTLSDV